MTACAIAHSKPGSNHGLVYKAKPRRPAPLGTMPVLHNAGTILLRKPACACGGSCPKCQSEQNFQPKLKIGAPNDKYEQEADRVAEQIVSGRRYLSTEYNPVQSNIQRMSSEGDEEVDVEEESVQRKSTSDANTEIPRNTDAYIQSLGGGGVPLSQSETNYYEPRFGQSFSNIRIHSGEAADKAAKSINARAFTLGDNIAFARGEHNSSSVSGRTLMAHELTHTLQQSAGTKSVQRGSAGILGGKCCNPASTVEWALVGKGVWKKLNKGECTGTTEDCDGMTCGGGFYHVDNLQTGSCSTPRKDDATFAPRRWTPTSSGANARSPIQEGSTQGDTPPGYGYDEAKTKKCTKGIRTVTVDFVRLAGATGSPATDLADTNKIYKKCCVKFLLGKNPKPVSLATTKSWLGGNTHLKVAPNCGDVDPEEKKMYDEGTKTLKLTSRMRAFYVKSFSYAAQGYSIPPYCATSKAAPYVNHLVIPNGVVKYTLGHELGHILLNSGVHAGIDNPADPKNFMFGTAAPVSDIDASQCKIMHKNA